MEKRTLDNRIWEIDALRGLLIPGMVLIHLIYDVVDLYGFVDWPYPRWYWLFKNNYGTMFVILSGISATLGRRSLRRGGQVFLGGMAVTLVTVGMYRLGMAGRGIIIYFGVLHCLGCCMMLWAVFSRLPNRYLAVLAPVLIFAGWSLRTLRVDFPWLLPLGFQFYGFSSSDYFPLMPYFGWFLLGGVMGRRLYPQKQSLLPGGGNGPVFRFFRWCGRHSLTIYLAHQPVLAALCEIYAIIRKL